MTDTTLRVILDVDTGVDDALAIALAVHYPRVALEAVVSVTGNVGLELTTRNTLRVLDWLDASRVPVYAGADRPLSGVLREARHWHAADGLGGAQLPEPTRAAQPGGVAYLCDRLLREPGALTLVCTGPLTNLALALEREPRIVDCAREVVLMGGAARLPGNVTPNAEFNIHADPHAAARVFAQTWPITMVGLNVTEQVRLSRQDVARLSASNAKTARLVCEVTRHLFDIRQMDSMALHDPLALAVAVQPDLVTTEPKDVDVETSGEYTLGETVVDWRATAPAPVRRTRVCTGVDVARALAFFNQTLSLSS